MESASCLLGTKEVVTSKDCWMLYLRGLLTDKAISPAMLQKALPGLVGQLACSDSPWALCAACTDSLKKAGFSPRLNPAKLPASGHALCRSTKLMQFVVLDEEGVREAQKAANAAAVEICR